MQRTYRNNKVLSKTLVKMIPACIMACFLEEFLLTIDTLLAGLFLNSDGIAAVSIGLPAYAMGISLLYIIIRGADLQMTWKLGHADQNAFHREFSAGLTLILTLGFLLSAVLFLFSDGVAALSGGELATPEVLSMASLYLKWCAPEVLLFSVASYLSYTVGLLGFQQPKVFSGTMSAVTNVVLSLILILWLPAEYKMVALGIGTSVAALVQSAVLLVYIKKHKLNLKFKPAWYTFKELKDTFRCGIPASCDLIFESIRVVLLNILVLSFFPGNTQLLSIAVVVDAIVFIGKCGSSGTSEAARYLFGILYAERDKDGLLHTLKRSIQYGMLFSLGWAVLIVAAAPLFATLFGMSGEPMVQQGLMIVLAFLPAINVVTTLTAYYENTEHFLLAIIYAVIPDSIFFPLLLIILIPLMGVNGIWVAMGSAFLVGVLLMYAVFMVKERNVIVPMDKFLGLKKEMLNRSPQLDVTIERTSTDVCGISAKIHHYLEEHGVSRRTAYIASLATEELAADVAAYADRTSKKAVDHMDVKVFVDEASMEIMLRIFGESYNPLNYADRADEFGMCGVKLAVATADKISYNYVYRLNTITIILKK